jgi:hypothetical protein
VDFWDLFWLFFIFIPITVLWVAVIIDCIGRPDIAGWKKAAWVIAAIAFPILGCIAYVIFRPSAWEIDMAQREKIAERNRRIADLESGVPQPGVQPQ